MNEYVTSFVKVLGVTCEVTAVCSLPCFFMS